MSYCYLFHTGTLKHPFFYLQVLYYEMIFVIWFYYENTKEIIVTHEKNTVIISLGNCFHIVCFLFHLKLQENDNYCH